jgi:hypothetical protein
MHRHKIVAQISLILCILNLVLAAPIGVQQIHGAPGGDETVVPEDVTLDRPTSPLSSPDVMASPQHSSLSDGATSSGYLSQYLSSDESVSGYSWMLDRLPRPNLHLSAPSHGSASPHPPGPSDEPASPHHPGLLQVPAPPHFLWEDWEPTPPSYSTSDRFTASHGSSGPDSPANIDWWMHYSPASGGSLHVHNSIPEGPTSAQPSPATATVPESDKFFNEDMVRKLKVFAGVTIITGAIVGIANSPIVHHNRQDG